MAAESIRLEDEAPLPHQDLPHGPEVPGGWEGLDALEAVQVEPAPEADFGGTFADNTRAVWKHPRGTEGRYVVYRDPGTASLAYRWSADGKAWSAAIPIASGSPKNFDLALHDTGADLRVFLVTVDGDGTVTYRLGILSDGSDTIAWQPAQTVVQATKVLSRSLAASIARTAEGRLVVAYASDVAVGTDAYRTTRIIGSDGDGAAPAWGGDVLWDDPGRAAANVGKDAVYYSLSPFGTNHPDRILLAAHVPDGGSSIYAVVTAAPVWNGVAFTGTAQTTLRGGVEFTDSLSCAVDGDAVAHCLVEDEWDLFSAKAATPGRDDWEPLILVVPPEDESGKSTLAIDRSASPNVLYAVYDKSPEGTGASQDLYVKASRADIVAWSGEVRVPYRGDAVALVAGDWGSAGGLPIAGLRENGALFYYELPLAARPASPSTGTAQDGASETNLEPPDRQEGLPFLDGFFDGDLERLAPRSPVELLQVVAIGAILIVLPGAIRRRLRTGAPEHPMPSRRLAPGPPQGGGATPSRRDPHHQVHPAVGSGRVAVPEEEKLEPPVAGRLQHEGVGLGPVLPVLQGEVEPGQALR